MWSNLKIIKLGERNDPPILCDYEFLVYRRQVLYRQPTIDSIDMVPGYWDEC